MPTESTGVSLGTITKVAYGLVILLVFFVVYKLLNKFNILGTSQATKDAKALSGDVSFANTVTNAVSDTKSDINKAIHGKFGAKPTPAQMKTLLPNFKSLPSLMTQVLGAHNTFTQNDASKILGAYRQLSSQYEINFFNTMMSTALKKDAWGMINDLMHDSDMETLREVINSKPLI